MITLVIQQLKCEKMRDGNDALVDMVI